MAARRSRFIWPLLVAAAIGTITALAARLPESRMPPRVTLPEAEGLQTIVSQVNQEFHRSWQEAGITPASAAEELTILRRLSLALLGTIPSLEEVRQFQADSRPDRLDHWTMLMLEDDRFSSYFAERLARSFVGVEQGQFLIFRRDRFLDWLTTQLRSHQPYDQIVRDMISGQGVWTGEGEVNFTTAAFANDEFDVNKLTARTVRAFLGQRIDCAQCHDHPFDHWKQQDFEGLAAHFGQVQLSLAGVVDHPHKIFDLPSEIAASLKPGPVSSELRKLFGKQRKGLREEAELVASGDGVWLVQEAPPEGQSAEEVDESSMMEPTRPRREIRYVLRKSASGWAIHERAGEFFVEDRTTLEERLIEPSVPFHPEWLPAEGTRRERLAAWVTHPENRRFERATVNRVWGVLFGEPYARHRPVDDLPDPDLDDSLTLLDLLGQDFREHGYDLRRLIRVIASAEVFRMNSIHPLLEQVADESLSEEEHLHSAAQVELLRDKWAVFPLIRLRPEQVIGGMVQSSYVRTVNQNSHLFTRFQRFIRERDFVNAFGDPGVDELGDRAGTIPQALLRMNGEFARELSEATPFSAAGRIGLIAAGPEELIDAVYLACLTRFPTAAEKEFFLAQPGFVAKGDARNDAIQDLVWTLFNSPEFSWNH